MSGCPSADQETDKQSKRSGPSGVWHACREFARDVDVLTVEIEHVDAQALESVQKDLGIDVEPIPRTLRVIQVTKLRQ